MDTTGLADVDVDRLEQAVSDVLASLAAPGSADGWTAAAAQELRRLLAARGAHAQLAALAMAADQGGTVSRGDVYRLAGYPAERSLTGFTRPLASAMRAMAGNGALPREAVLPLRPVYGHGNAANQKASAFAMPQQLIPFFRDPVSS